MTTLHDRVQRAERLARTKEEHMIDQLVEHVDRCPPAPRQGHRLVVPQLPRVPRGGPRRGGDRRTDRCGLGRRGGGGDRRSGDRHGPVARAPSDRDRRTLDRPDGRGSRRRTRHRRRGPRLRNVHRRSRDARRRERPVRGSSPMAGPAGSRGRERPLDPRDRGALGARVDHHHVDRRRRRIEVGGVRCLGSDHRDRVVGRSPVVALAPRLALRGTRR